MTHNIERFGKAMTAIAAVLAFSTTQSFAQDTTTTPEPVADSSVQMPQTTDPLAPDPTASESAPTAEAATPPAPKPKVETSRAATPRARPSTRASTPRPTVQRATASRASATAAPATAAPTAAAPAPAPLPTEPILPVAVEPTAPPPIAEPAPVSDNANSPMAGLMADDMLPIAGAAALGLIALAGAGIAMRRRQRRREEEEFEARQQALAMAEAEPAAPEPALELDRSNEVRTEPAFFRAPAPVHDPVPDRTAPAAGQPDGFDVSRFGPHVQAAYRGPTADNPSVSLQYRVRRAAALDEQERDPPTPPVERR